MTRVPDVLSMTNAPLISVTQEWELRLYLTTVGDDAHSFRLYFPNLPGGVRPANMGYKLMYHAACYMLSAIKRDGDMPDDKWAKLCEDVKEQAERLALRPEFVGPEPENPGSN